MPKEVQPIFSAKKQKTLLSTPAWFAFKKNGVVKNVLKHFCKVRSNSCTKLKGIVFLADCWRSHDISKDCIILHKDCRILQKITEYCKRLQNIAKDCRILEKMTEYCKRLQGIAERLQNIRKDHRLLGKIARYYRKIAEFQKRPQNIAKDRKNLKKDCVVLQKDS